MYLDPKIKITDFDGKTATVKTKGLYCVVYHGPKEKDYEHDEFLTAKGAIWHSTLHNRWAALEENPTWAEPISYKELRKRYDSENESARRERAIESGVAERLAELETEAPRLGVIRKLITRAAAMIW